jgi:hypothetical protein
MPRLLRLVLGVALVSAAACGTPTAPPAPNIKAPNLKPLLDCIGGYEVTNGVWRPC